MIRSFPCLILLLAISWGINPRAADAKDKEEKPAATATAQPSQDDLEQQFADKLSGAVLEGSFTADDAPAGEAPKPDRYQLGSVKKGKNGYFLIEANIGESDTPFRMPVLVKWAGDTPVITLTNVLIPGAGTFTARVLFYEDRYAGTWQGGDHGGTMFGRILTGEEAKASSKSDADQDDSKDDE